MAALAAAVDRHRRGGPVPGLHRAAVGRDGRAAGVRLRHAAPPGERVALGHRVRWAGVEHAEDLGAALGAVPGGAGRRAGRADGRQGPRRVWCSPTLRGGVLRNSNWRARVFEPAVQECQKTDETFPTITPHDLRHTAASLAVVAGANVKAVQRMLGHAKASMTLDVYADLFDEDLDSVAESLDAAIVKASSAATAAGSGGSPAPPLLPQGVYDC